MIFFSLCMYAVFVLGTELVVPCSCYFCNLYSSEVVPKATVVIRCYFKALPVYFCEKSIVVSLLCKGEDLCTAAPVFCVHGVTFL
jgi:hypothetical protein